MKAKIAILSLAATLMLASCGNAPETSTKPSISEEPSITTPSTSTSISTPEEKVWKEKDGANVIFDEELGYNTKDATMLEIDGSRYVIYSSNEEKFSETNVFAARKGELKNNTWVYGEKHIVLRPGEGKAWDKNIQNQTVVKGNFAYNDANYKYIMAYNATSLDAYRRNSIGLAVSNDILGEWTKVGDAPFLKFDDELYGDRIGYTTPSLINFDEQGTLIMYYTMEQDDLTSTNCLVADFSNLNDINYDGSYHTLTVKGLQDGGDVTIFANGGFAHYNDTQYVVRDVYPLSANRPNNASSVEIAHANNVWNDNQITWTHDLTIDTFLTMDLTNEESLGWDEIYSGTFVTNEYGKLTSIDKIEVIYSTFNEPDVESDTTYKFTSQLASYVLEA